MKFFLALLVLVAAALPARSAPALHGRDEARGSQGKREKKSYTDGNGEANRQASSVPSVGASIGNTRLGADVGLGYAGAGFERAGLGPIGLSPYSGYYGLRPFGGISPGALGRDGHFRNVLEQRNIVDASAKMNAGGETQEKQDNARFALGLGHGGGVGGYGGYGAIGGGYGGGFGGGYGGGYGGGFGGGYGGGALGLFPGAVGGGCGGIPLLVSCTPNLVAGHVVSGLGHGFGHGGLYRSVDEADKVIPPVPAASAAPSHRNIAATSTSFQQQRHSASSMRVGGNNVGSFNPQP